MRQIDLCVSLFREFRELCGFAFKANRRKAQKTQNKATCPELALHIKSGSESLGHGTECNVPNVFNNLAVPEPLWDTSGHAGQRDERDKLGTLNFEP